MRLFLQSFLLLFALTAVCAADDDWKDFVGPERLAFLESVDTLPATFYVSPDGDDAWSGRLAAPNAEKTDGPFRSFEKARDALRALRASAAFDGKPTAVEIRPGLYEVSRPLVLTGEDSGTAESPVIWRGVCGGDGEPLAEIRGGVTVSGGKKVEDTAVLARLQPQVRDKVLEFDLKAFGVEDYGALDGSDNAELFYDHRPMTIARYPNEGFMKFDEVNHEDNQIADIRGVRGVKIPKLLLPNADLSLWAGETDAWALGYWFWDWANSRQKIVRVDTEKKEIELAPPYHSYGYRPGQYFYVYHALCELDAPGEYYIDEDSGKLYFYPPGEVTNDNLFFSVEPKFVEGTGLRYFALSGLHFNGCRKEGVTLRGSDILVRGCLIRNTGGGGVVSAGDRHLLFGNHLYNIGSYGFDVNSGDRGSLTHGQTAVVNNDVHHYGRIQRMYAAAVGFNGCGVLVAQNRFSDAPHCAILFGGNDHRIERNEIFRVCEESNDAGAVYIGRNWTCRGNVVRQNYLHDISGFEGRGCVGVYLDDMLSTVDIVENLFVNVTCAVMIGGGRDNHVLNNLFVDCKPNLHVDARALGWCSDHADGWIAEYNDKGTISGIDVKSDLWAAKYPALAAIMDGTPKAPEGNVIEGNVVISTAGETDGPKPFEGDEVESKARDYITLQNNVEGDLRLLLEMTRGGYDRIPGTDVPFRRIPVEKIGLFEGNGAISR